MKKIFTLILGVLIMSGIFASYSVVYAGDPPPSEGSAPGSSEGQGSAPGGSGSNTGGNNGGSQNQTPDDELAGTSFQISIKNPLKNIDTLNGLIVKILNIILTIGVPFVALMIIYSGFLFVKAQGDPGKLKEAKATLLWVLIGGTILLSAWIIAKALAGTVSQIVNGS